MSKSARAPPRATARHCFAPKQQAQAAATEVPRFYVARPLRDVHGDVVDLGRDEAKHAARVLRLKTGDTVEICDGRGGLARGEVQFTEKSSAKVLCSHVPQFHLWEGRKLRLYVGCGGLKGGRGDWLVEKATELGAFGLVPILTDRSKIFGGKGSERGSGRMSRWERVAQSAMKQCLRLHALEIESPIQMGEMVEQIKKSDHAHVALANAPPVAQLLEGDGGNSRVSNHMLIIGPEGDFTDSEREAMIDAGAIPVGLGPNRLRVETAAIALLTAFRLCLYSSQPYSKS